MIENIKDVIKKVLILLSVRVLKKHKPYIIAIMGSVGKTTARNAIYVALSRKHSVRKSEQSFTTDIGVPLTLLGCPYNIYTVEGFIHNTYTALKQAFFSKEYPQYVILEIDGQSKGEISRLADWISIDLLVVTAIGEIPAHVEYFNTPDNMRMEYGLIRQALKENSKIVIYGDDEYARAFTDDTHQVISYGTSKNVDISADDYEIVYENDLPVGVSFICQKPSLDKNIVVKGKLGVHVVNGILCAMAVLQALGEHPFSMNSEFEKMPIPPGRMNILQGIKGSVILDDSYNSSPVAVEELLVVLKKVRAQRKILVLGDMLELGRFSAEAHREIGREIAQQSGHIHMLICVGLRSQFIKEGALEAGFNTEMISVFDAPEKAGQFLQNILTKGDLVAIKGSQNMRMERCVEEIMLEPEKKTKLLVRQTPEWLGR